MTQSPLGRPPHKAIPWAYAAMPAYTVGLLAPVPFLYAAVRLQIRKLWLIAAAYGAIWITVWVLIGAAPEHSALNTLSGSLLLALAAAGTTHAFVLRETMPRRFCPRCRMVGPQQGMAPIALPASDPTQATCAEVWSALASLKSSVATHAEQFPSTCKPLFNETIAPIEQVVSFVARGGHADSELCSVHAIATDYLPTSINTYVRLPREYALSQRNPDGRTPAEELELQLRLLRDSAQEAVGSLYRSDARRLEEQSAFLQSKFGKSDLDLP